MNYFTNLVFFSFKASPFIASAFLFLALLFSSLDVSFLFLINTLNFSDTKSLLADVAQPRLYLLLLLAIISLFRISGFYFALMLARNVSISLNNLLLVNFLSKPLRRFSISGPKQLSHIMTVESDLFYEGILYPFFVSSQLIFSSSLLLLSALLLNPLLFLIISIVGSFLAFISFRFIYPPLSKISNKISALRTGFSLAVSQFFENIDYLRSTSSGLNYLTSVKSNDFNYKTYSSYGFIFGLAPKMLLESVVLIIFLSAFILLSHVNLSSSYIDSIFAFLLSAAFIFQRLISSFLILGVSLLSLGVNKGRTANYLKLLKENIFSSASSEYILSQSSHLGQAFHQLDTDWTSISMIDLKINYSNVKINIGDFKIKRGQKVGISGPSGSGKSTLLKILLGTEDPTEGNLYIDNRPSDFRKLLHLSSPSFQKPFFLYSSLLDNITSTPNASSDVVNTKLFADIVYVCGLYPLIDEYGLTSSLGEYCSSLSGGQQLRLSIARALFSNTSIVILDEPTSALDFNSSSLLLSRLCKTFPELSLIIVSHNTEDFEFCDIVYYKHDMNSPLTL